MRVTTERGWMWHFGKIQINSCLFQKSSYLCFKFTLGGERNLKIIFHRGSPQKKLSHLVFFLRPKRTSGLFFFMATHKHNRRYVEFTKLLREDGRLSLWVAFDSLKRNTELINGKCADLNGGFIRRKEIESHSKKVKMKPATLVKKLNLMVKFNWAEKTKTGYRLKSWKVVASMYGFDDLKERIVIGTTKRAFNQNAAYTEIKAYMSQAVHCKFKEINRREKVSNSLLKYETKLNLIREQEIFNPTPSVRQIAKKLGFKSPRTISTINQNLSSRGLLTIKRNDEIVCTAENFPQYIKGFPDLKGCHYRKLINGEMFVKRRNKQTIFLN